jgi:hypothetical protein
MLNLHTVAAHLKRAFEWGTTVMDPRDENNDRNCDMYRDARVVWCRSSIPKLYDLARRFAVAFEADGLPYRETEGLAYKFALSVMGHGVCVTDDYDRIEVVHLDAAARAVRYCETCADLSPRGAVIRFELLM